MKGMNTLVARKADPPPRGAVEEVKVHARLPGELVGEVGKEADERALEGHGVLVGQVDVGAGDADEFQAQICVMKLHLKVRQLALHIC